MGLAAIAKSGSHQDILKAFLPVRLDVYEKRKALAAAFESGRWIRCCSRNVDLAMKGIHARYVTYVFSKLWSFF